MQKVCIIGAASAFFKAVVTRIICIIGASYVNFGRRVRGGVDYWRGHVFGGGAVGKKGGGAVNAEQIGATQGGFVAEAVALYRLAVGLAGYSKSGGALRGAGVKGGEGGKNRGHFAGSPVLRARCIVVANPAWGRYERPLYLRKRVVDALGVHRQKNNHPDFSGV